MAVSEQFSVWCLVQRTSRQSDVEENGPQCFFLVFLRKQLIPSHKPDHTWTLTLNQFRTWPEGPPVCRWVAPTIQLPWKAVSPGPAPLLQFCYPVGVLSYSSTEHNPKINFSSTSVLGLTTRRSVSDSLSTIFSKTKPAQCKVYSSQGFFCRRISYVSLGRNQNGSSSCSMTIKAKRGQWEHNLAYREMCESGLLAVSQTEF